jgi:ABC-2 type transport system ATP-binding protein
VQAVGNHVQIINNGQLIFNGHIDDLFSQKQSSVMQIALHRPPDIQILKQIQGVKEVEVQDNNRFRIQYIGDNTPTEVLVEKSVAGNWGLYELIPKHRSLEQVFVALMDADEMHSTNEGVLENKDTTVFLKNN